MRCHARGVRAAYAVLMRLPTDSSRNLSRLRPSIGQSERESCQDGIFRATEIFDDTGGSRAKWISPITHLIGEINMIAGWFTEILGSILWAVLIASFLYAALFCLP